MMQRMSHRGFERSGRLLGGGLDRRVGGRALWVVAALLLSVSSLLALGQTVQPGGESASGAAGGVIGSADRQARNVAIISIRTGDGPIDRVTAQSFIRRLKIAEEQGADAVVVEIDTPGGEIGAVLDICHAIKQSSITNTVAWINTKAISGGAIIALACREMIVNDPVSFGDAIPIAASPMGGLQELPEEERAKLLIALLEELIDSARRRNQFGYVYDEFIVQAIVTTGVELWLVRDTQTGVQFAIGRSKYKELFGEPPTEEPTLLASVSPAEGAAPGASPPLPAPEGGAGRAAGGGSSTEFEAASPRLENLSPQISEALELPNTRPAIDTSDPTRYQLIVKVMDGTGPAQMNASSMYTLNFAANNPKTNPIRTEGDIKAWFNAENVRRLDPLWSEGLVKFMTHPIVRGVLLVAFLLGLFVEMISPGIGVAGGFAVLALLALLVPPYLMGLANWWEIVAVGGGILLIILEIFVFPGFGLPGILGLLALFGGLLGTFVPDQGGGLFPDSARDQQDLLYGVVTLVMAVATSLVGMFFLSKHFGTVPILSKLVLKDAPADAGSDELIAAMGYGKDRPRIGEEGRALTTLRPVGEVELEGRVIDAVAEGGYIRGGEPVRVVEVTEFRTVVARVPEGDVGDRAEA
ncbi:MAG: NfeD family protein [Phycisphaerales bacterium JB037]